MFSSGISIKGCGGRSRRFRDRLDELGLIGHVAASDLTDKSGMAFRLNGKTAREVVRDVDEISLCDSIALDPIGNPDDLEREILLAMMLSPVHLPFRNHDELASAVRIRKNIVMAAHQTALAFDTSAAAERPDDCWTYSEENGFTVLPGVPLIDALRKATQPEVSGSLYDFSCYRATEYVFLLGLAEELANCNPDLLARLQKQWETRAIKSGEFHDVFLVEYGSMANPLPPRFYIPGDRLWFRNPDDRSSDVKGYEGSWVFYLGGGLFTNFWKRNQPYTLTSKCLEIYHWRNGAYTDAAGELRMDEELVEARVGESLTDPEESDRIMHMMMRWRDPQGVYAEGGCIDTSREYARTICHKTDELVLPDA
jgi:hypothetical protein